jgi:predicted PilT family ATPase
MKLTIKLPKLSINTRKGIINIDGDTIEFPNGFSEEEKARIIQSIEDNFWEYQVYEFQNKNLIDNFFSIVYTIDPLLYMILQKDKEKISFHFIYEDNLLLVTLKGNLKEYAGRLIGKQGQKIKKIQEALGVKMKVLTAEETHDELKSRMEELLKRLI